VPVPVEQGHDAPSDRPEDRLDFVIADRRRLVKRAPGRAVAREHAVQDQRMHVDVEVQRGAEALHHGHGPAAEAGGLEAEGLEVIADDLVRDALSRATRPIRVGSWGQNLAVARCVPPGTPQECRTIPSTPRRGIAVSVRLGNTGDR